MAIRELLQLGDERLTKDNLEITDFGSEKIKQVIIDLIETMKKKDWWELQLHKLEKISKYL